MLIIETLAQIEDVGEDIELIKMEFTNHENYDSDDSFIAAEAEPTAVYGDSDSDSDDEDEEERKDIAKVRYLVPVFQSRPRRIVLDFDLEYFTSLL